MTAPDAPQAKGASRGSTAIASASEPRPGRSETRYTTSSGVSIAYRVVGESPLDLVVVPGWVSNLEAAWEDPDHADFYRRLAGFSRLILFDKRGTGLSDRVAELPSLEVRMEDVRAVLDAAGSERAALLGCRKAGRCARCSRPPIRIALPR